MSVDYTPVIEAAHDAFGYHTVTLSPARSSETYEVDGAQWDAQMAQRQDDDKAEITVDVVNCQIEIADCPTDMPAPQRGWTLEKDDETWSVATVRGIGDVAYRLRLERHLIIK